MNIPIQIISEELAQTISEATIEVETEIAALAVRRKLKIVSTHSEYSILIAYLSILLLVSNVAVTLTDVLAFLAVIRQVWGLWKEKRRLRLEGERDFVTLLLQQVVRDLKIFTVGSDIGAFQNVYELFYILMNAHLYLLPLRLSTILICEFTLELRRRNTTARSLPNQSALELPDLNFSSQGNPVRSISVLGGLQERIIADMGERSDSVDIDGPSQGESA
ncbi:hypothetical protein Clacol_004644 [Clathrus columnatus]|uniref:Uncharacterized protein n=1 Tax=Clathrus columnatus TaxID=1419009 RepID=A0AAV5AB68_9AGAM|nr:hypothetical protein Clacol_004644 [Clathrus columnatus]